MSVRRAPRALAETMERRRRLPDSPGEHVTGYGALGLPFESGHVLAFRRVVAASPGSPGISLWHREPSGRWTFYVNVEPRASCARFFGSAVDELVVTDIELAWTGPYTLTLAVPRHRMQWGLRLWQSPATWMTNRLLAGLPGAVWSSPGLLRAMEPAAVRLLGVAGLALTGTLPNGQAFRARPTSLWRVEGSVAVVRGEELGRTRPLAEAPTVGGFPVANGGLMGFGRSVQEPFDPERHAGILSREGAARRDGP